MKIVTGLSLTSASCRPNHGWQPTVLFRGGEQGALFTPSQGAALFSDPEGTVTAQFGGSVALMNDASGKSVNAVQATASARPIYGRVPAMGRRNLLEETETLVSGIWTVTEATTAPEGDGVVSITPSTNKTAHSAYLVDFTTWDDNGDYTYSIEVKGSDTGVFDIVRFASRDKGNTFPGVWVDLTDGSKEDRQSPTATTVTDMGDGWYRITLTANAGTGAATALFQIVLASGGTSSFAGDGSAALLVRKPQAEAGATATDYQRVGSTHDVTEDGVRSLAYLYADGDDELEATLPDLGTDATVAYASDQGVTIQTGQTIGAGAFDVLRDDMLFGMVVIDRALTTAETARLTAWLNHKGGEYA